MVREGKHSYDHRTPGSSEREAPIFVMLVQQKPEGLLTTLQTKEKENRDRLFVL